MLIGVLPYRSCGLVLALNTLYTVDRPPSS